LSQARRNPAIVAGLERRLGSDEFVPIDQRVSITWTNCALGGKRPWFLCPFGSLRCGRRVAKLYLGSYGRFECRQCCGLVYRSQQETGRLRVISRARKIRMKLGGSASLADPFPEKPPRMHWRTYCRIQSRAAAVEGQLNPWLMRTVAKQTRDFDDRSKLPSFRHPRDAKGRSPARKRDR
jgi:hypothetical protein